MSLGRKVAVGVVWLVAIKWVTQLLSLVSTLVLARILIPEDFGVVALATAFVAIVEGMTMLPVNQALIRFQNPARSFYDTAWTLSTMRGCLIALAMYLGAVPIADLIGEDRLEAVIAVLAILPLIAGLENPRFVDFEKNLVFSKSFVLQVGSKFVLIAVTIGFAVVLRSYWAIIIGNLFSTAVQVGLSYYLNPYRPRFTLKENRAIFGFSGWLWGTSFVRTLNMQADKFVIGGLLSTSAVGVYYLGTTLSRTLIGSFTNSLIRALYPSFTLVGDNLQKLRRNVLEASAILVAVTLPLGFGLALVAEEFVNLLLGPKWLATIPIIKVLVPVLAMSSLTTVTDPVVMARGQTRLMFYRACLMLVVRLSAVVGGVLNWGLIGAVYGWAASHVFFLTAQLLLLSRILGIPFYSPIVGAWRTWVSLGCMVLAIQGVEHLFFAIDEASDLLSLATKIAAAGVAYGLVHTGLWLVAGQPSGPEKRILMLAGGALSARRSRS